MTVRVIVCGWEGGHIQQFSDSTSGTMSATSGAARSGGYGLKINPTAGASRVFRQYSATPLSDSVGRIYFRYESSLPAADCNIMDWDSNSGKFYRLIFQNSTSKVRMEHITSGVRDEVQDGPVLTGGTWYRLDWRLGTAGAKQMEWQIDGVAQTTVGPNAAYFGAMFGWSLGNAAGSQTYVLNFDDSISVDGVNDATDNIIASALYPIGEGYVKYLPTTGVGTHNNAGNFGFSSGVAADSWQLLDQLPMLATTDWVSQTVIGTGDYLEYTHGQLASNEVPNGVRWYIGGLSEFFNPSNIKLHGLDGASDYTLITDLGADFVAHVRSAQAPVHPWTQSQVNGLRSRLGYSSDVTSNPKVYSMFLEVDVKIQSEPEGWPDAYLGIITI